MKRINARKVLFASSLLLMVVAGKFINSATAIELANITEANMRNVSLYPEIARDLVNRKMFFTAIPLLKEYLTNHQGQNIKLVDSLIDEATAEVGIKQFEVLPAEFLAQSTSPVIRYILAKKFFRIAKHDRALDLINNSIPEGHPIMPYALLLRASIYSIKGNSSAAIESYRSCIHASKKQIERENDPDRIKQLEINRDYCIVGIPRNEFATGQYDSAYSNYLDLPKESGVWPEILFEEAWNSFYLRDYNRTLGKLVTYKAPIFEHIFNPEIDALKALTFMEMCLWDDAKKIVEEFYSTYQSDYNTLENEYKRIGNDYQYYYNSAKEKKEGVTRGNNLFGKILGAIVKDPVFIEMFNSFRRGEYELNAIKEINNKNLKQMLGTGIRDALLLQRDLLGAYVKNSVGKYLSQVYRTFQSMSYIKLEVLGKKKEALFARTDDLQGQERERGSFIYLKRTDKQYFWNFIGEFWADELGDYVFALKSECEP